MATARSVVRRALRVALVVGGVLVIVNHGDALVEGSVSVGRALQMVITVVVPYAVSTYSSVGMMLESRKDAAHASRELRVSD